MRRICRKEGEEGGKRPDDGPKGREDDRVV